MISVVIPHFERLALLKETLQSVQAQTGAEWEVVIVDDGSTSSVWQAVQELAGEKVRVLQRKDGMKGPSRCRNLGLAAARGNYVLFLDSDDLLGPSCLSARERAIGGHPEYDFWVFPVQLFRQHPGDLQVGWNEMTEAGDDLRRFLRSDGPWCVSSSLWRKSALLTIGGFNEQMLYGDDADLHIRALLAGLRFCQFPQHLPDIFIRRSDLPRITGGASSAALLESRLVRLTQVQRALRDGGAAEDLLKLWQSQYFMEGEFLLFNQRDPAIWLNKLWQQWRVEYPRGGWRQRLAGLYFIWSAFWRDRWYLQVRMARRVVSVLLPQSWFPVSHQKGTR